MLAPGDPAPDFTLPSTLGRDVSLKSLRGQKVVLYFYPKDNTPGCTQEACDFRDHGARLASVGAMVLGVSKDSLASHQKFRDKYALPFVLLSDTDNHVGQAYGAYGKKMLYGKQIIGTIRSTFVIDEHGKVLARWSPVKVAGHVEDVVAVLNGGAPSKPVAPKKAQRSKKPSRRGKAARRAGSSRRSRRRSVDFHSLMER